MQNCPLCGQRGLGKVGVDQYFCSECCMEFTVRGGGIRIFNIESDGTLTHYAPPAEDAVSFQA